MVGRTLNADPQRPSRFGTAFRSGSVCPDGVPFRLVVTDDSSDVRSHAGLWVRTACYGSLPMTRLLPDARRWGQRVSRISPRFSGCFAKAPGWKALFRGGAHFPVHRRGRDLVRERLTLHRRASCLVGNSLLARRPSEDRLCGHDLGETCRTIERDLDRLSLADAPGTPARLTQPVVG